MTRVVRPALRSCSKKKRASESRGRTTRWLPAITLAGSAKCMLETIRKRFSSLPAASKSGKYFWLARIVEELQVEGRTHAPLDVGAQLLDHVPAVQVRELVGRRGGIALDLAHGGRSLEAGLGD